MNDKQRILLALYFIRDAIHAEWDGELDGDETRGELILNGEQTVTVTAAEITDLIERLEDGHVYVSDLNLGLEE
jgi:hypothetical protein